MTAYIGQIVTLTLKNEGGEFCGKIVSHDQKKKKITLTKGSK